MGDIPQSQPTDNDDISLALDVARARLGAGDHEEAIKWLRKAADAAFDAGDDRRGMELSKAAAELKPAPGAAAAGPPVPGPKPAPIAAGKSPSQPGRSAVPPSGLPKPIQKPTVPSASQMHVKPTVSRSQPPPKRMPSKAPPAAKPQITKPKPEEEESTREFQVDDRPPARIEEEPSDALMEEAAPRGPHGDEWPTESVAHMADVGDFTDRMHRDEVMKQTEELPLCPSLRVAVWRTAEGTVMLRPLDTAGLNDGEHDMMLVALVPDADLRELFR
jgi:hypothetical protein